MFIALVIFQLVCIVIAFITIITIIRTKNMFEGKYLILAMSGAFLQSTAYLIEITSTDLQSAMTAVKFEYLGASMGIYLLYSYVLRVCRVKFPPVYYIAILGIFICTTFAVFTYEYHEYYYVNLEYVYEGAYPHISFEKGPLYYVHMINVYYVIFSMLFITMRRYSVTRNAERKSKVFVSLIFTFGTLSAVLIMAYLVGLLGYFDPVPFAMLMISLFVRINIYDITPVALEMVIDNISDSVIIVDRDFKYLDCNPEAKRVFPELDYAQQGLPISKFSPRFGDYFAHGGKCDFEIGSTYYSCNIIDIINHGKIQGYTAYVTDVTEEHRSIQRLIEMKEKADVANRAKSEFLANTSHEIRTPMNAILGMTELALRENMEPALRENLYSIQTAGNTLLFLINEILDFSKIESNKAEIYTAPYRFSQVISDVAQIVNTRIVNKNITFRTDISESIPSYLLGDEMRIKQILINLLTNAVKYTEKGFIDLKITWEKTEDGGAILTAAVSDTGAGISRENLDKLFTSFERVDSRRNRSIEGAGLGLAITKALLDLMGGTISVTSEYCKGSTFTFTLPQGIVDETPTGSGYISEEIADDKSSGFVNTFTAPNAQVLVVDDNPTNLGIAAAFLHAFGIDADTAGSGKQCIIMVAQKKYDLVLLDYMMPILDGTDTLRILRLNGNTDPYYKELPIIVFTADAINGSHERFIKTGFNDYMSKPVNMKSFDTILRHWLSPELIIERNTLEEEARPKETADFEIDGVVTDIGIENCGTLADYKRVLAIFLKHGYAKEEKIRSLLRQEEYEDYTIEVHSLKSSAANIGALEVSRLARELELAGKNHDKDYIGNHTEELLGFFRSLLDNVDICLTALENSE